MNHTTSIGFVRVASILGLLFLPAISFAEYVPVQNFADPAVPASSRNEYVNKVAFSYVATTTHKIETFSFVVFRSGGSGTETIYLTTATGDNSDLTLRHLVATSSSVVVNTTAGDNATTTVTFAPPLQFSSGVTVTFFFHSEDATNHTILFTPQFPSAYPAYVFDYLGSGIWENGVVVGANYAGSFFTSSATGTQPTFEICTIDNPNCTMTAAATPECQITDIGACVGNAISWAFTPSSGSWDRFITLKDEIKNKAPFGYLTSAIAAIGGIEGSTTPAFSLATSSPLMTYIFNPLRTGLAWLLYLATLLWIYKRVTHIET